MKIEIKYVYIGSSALWSTTEIISQLKSQPKSEKERTVRAG